MGLPNVEDTVRDEQRHMGVLPETELGREAKNGQTGGRVAGLRVYAYCLVVPQSIRQKVDFERTEIISISPVRRCERRDVFCSMRLLAAGSCRRLLGPKKNI